MVDTGTFGYFITETIYIILLTASIHGTLLYRKAYYQMKRTPMIRSVYLLMMAIAFDSAYFLVATVAQQFHKPIEETLLSPWLLTIPKMAMLGGLGYFLYRTLSPNDVPPENKVQVAGRQISEAIRKMKE